MTIDLRYGDTIEQMKLIPDKSIDFICCDLPYGSTKNHWDIVIPFEQLWEQYKRIIKDDGAIALFGTGLFAYKLALSNEKMYKYEIIWHKSKSGSSFTAKYRPVQNTKTFWYLVKVRSYITHNLKKVNPIIENEKQTKEINQTIINLVWFLKVKQLTMVLDTLQLFNFFNKSGEGKTNYIAHKNLLN